MATDPGLTTWPLSPQQQKDLMVAVIVSSIFGVIGYFTTKYVVHAVNKVAEAT